MHAFVSKMNLYGCKLYIKHNATSWACSDSVINNIKNGYILLSAYYVSGFGLSHLHLSTVSLHTTREWVYIFHILFCKTIVQAQIYIFTFQGLTDHLYLKGTLLDTNLINTLSLPLNLPKETDIPTNNHNFTLYDSHSLAKALS